MFDRQKWEFVSIKNVTLATQHVLYLENDLVLMSQFLPHFPSANMFSLNSKTFQTNGQRKVI